MGARLVAACGAALPDLSAVNVLVPHARLIAPVKRACAKAAAAQGFAVILPPQVRTWRGWAEELGVALTASGQPSPMTTLARLAFVARHLQRAVLLPGDAAAQARSSWRLARGVLRLVDALTEAAWARGRSDADAADVEAFLTRLKFAYGSAASVAERQLEAESRLVFSVWQALIADVQAPDPVAFRLRALEQIKPDADAPLFVLTHAPAALTAVERRLIASYEMRAPVYIIGVPVENASAMLLDCAWNGGPALFPTSEAALQQVRILAARSLEAEARAGVQQIHAWLAAGLREIAIVALDRASARRLRALLERDQILLEDEGGWRLSTTSAAAAVMRLIDLAHVGVARADYREVLDLLKSPLVFADLQAAHKSAALKVIERALTQAQASTGLATMVGAVRAVRYGNLHHSGEMAEESIPERLLGRLQAVLTQFGVLARRARASSTLGDWFSQCQAALESLGMLDTLRADVAGQQVLVALDDAAVQLQGLSGEVAVQPLTVWRDLVAELFETTEFRDPRISSSIKLTQLNAMPLRQFEAVLVVGADGAHLLPPPPELPLVKSSVRRDFGLPGADENRAEMRATLAWLVASAGALTFTWQAQRGKRPVPMAAELELLERAHRRCFGVSLLSAAGEPAVDPIAMPGGSMQSAAPSAVALLPTRVSVSGYASLIACPYQFFARSLLRLREEDEIRLNADQRDVGLLLHRILNRLHSQVPRFSGSAQADLQARFSSLVREEATHLVGAQYLALGWLARFTAAFPAYAQWQVKREAAGWAFAQGEIKAERHFEVDEQTRVSLYGRLDRVDQRTADSGAGEVAVLDYKTQGRETLRGRAKHAGEDVQLSSYALLQRGLQPVTEALYLPLRPDKDGKLDQPHFLPADMLDGMAEEARLVSLFKHLHAGAAMPANAAAKVCAVCEMRGVCRRSFTDEADEFGETLQSDEVV